MNMCSYNCFEDKCSESSDIKNLSELLKLVGDESRLRLLCVFRDGGEHCVCELMECVNDLSQSLISHHLADLKNAELVASNKVGKRAYYRLTAKGERTTQAIFKLINTGE